NGRRPMLLSSDRVEYFSAAFYLRNPVVGGLTPDTLLISRERFVGETMHDLLTVTNEGADEVQFELALEFGSDFADILVVKSRDVAFGDPTGARPLPELVRPVYDGDDNQFLLEDNGNRGPRAQIMLSQRGEAEGGVVTYRIALSARRAWELEVDVVPDYDGRRVVRGSDEHRFGDEVRHVRASLAAWHLSVPRLSATWSDLGHSFSQSVADPASLRIRGRNGTNGELPAAGMPWFMTVFGRDTLITCLQTLLFGPDLARSALEALAELQAREDDPSVDAEPGKIVHEVRHGKAAE